ncbi:EAL domain-containing protein [Pantanalinema rosaneae CENA516]|uniref:two-component system response regulator n=1 Tax=Pantanalinema rosaneae TaxID=1620701 RepID=UPI003D6E4889
MSPSQVLIVEDELLIAQSLARKLTKLGHTVVDIVSSGEAAILAAIEKVPDLVLMDIVIKGEMDGIDAANRIYQDYGIPVIYLTAYADDETLQRAEKTGCYGYILKPFKEKELNATIRMAINKHQQETQVIKSLEIADNLSKKLQATLRQTVQRLTSPDQTALQTDIYFALDNRELQVYYQPFVNLTTGQIVGAEALLRWHHPHQGMILPANFIPLAEETGVIELIGEWVLHVACSQIQVWQRRFSLPLSVSVNLSTRHFKQNTAYRQVAQAIAATHLDATSLSLELPESMFMHDTDGTIRMAHELKEMGVQLAIDDFGTGYASLSYLQRFPFDTLKIDRCFIGNVNQNADKVAITQAIIQMAHSLSLNIVAEGVETEAEKQFLQQHHCNIAQGYFFSPPVPSTTFEQLLLAQHLPIS